MLPQLTAAMLFRFPVFFAAMLPHFPAAGLSLSLPHIHVTTAIGTAMPQADAMAPCIPGPALSQVQTAMLHPSLPGMFPNLTVPPLFPFPGAPLSQMARALLQQVAWNAMFPVNYLTAMPPTAIPGTSGVLRIKAPSQLIAALYTPTFPLQQATSLFLPLIFVNFQLHCGTIWPCRRPLAFL